MSDPYDMSCHCGATRWTIARAARGTLVKCYCADCQTFARHLGHGTDWLDAAGGSAIFQTAPHNLGFPDGMAHVALLRLGPKGLFRWYADCCGTPIANTLSGPGFPFVGAVLQPDENRFGPVRVWANTAAARTPVKARGIARAVLGVLGRAALARLTGSYRTNPFFDAAGAPVAPPTVLSKAERDAARPH
ncbi:DUF6151 family protein [Defluviimonas sp. WL0024]|uniref:DUF6151 family protein n=2 Tax=Albidovulum TaxID=205889 RepID=A0ABT3J023_9RHOB|nr:MULTISPECIES: DUF6151 family protein [Defluviimonas]MCU9849687.1 DUF6151 family protein [Defluviimonas sp. WL0024]MCW3780774.1 DUF6151 family protein [Defluviimonas salinarum]